MDGFTASQPASPRGWHLLHSNLKQLDTQLNSSQAKPRQTNPKLPTANFLQLLPNLLSQPAKLLQRILVTFARHSPVSTPADVVVDRAHVAEVAALVALAHVLDPFSRQAAEAILALFKVAEHALVELVPFQHVCFHGLDVRVPGLAS
jgi:hypothetical protein